MKRLPLLSLVLVCGSAVAASYPVYTYVPVVSKVCLIPLGERLINAFMIESIHLGKNEFCCERRDSGSAFTPDYYGNVVYTSLRVKMANKETYDIREGDLTKQYGELVSRIASCGKP